MRRRPRLVWMAAAAGLLLALVVVLAAQPGRNGPHQVGGAPTTATTTTIPPAPATPPTIHAPVDAWIPQPAALPAPPRISHRVTIPRSWQHLRDIAPAFERLLAASPDGTQFTFPAGDYHVHLVLDIERRHDIALTGPPSGAPARLLQWGDGRGAPNPGIRPVIDFSWSVRTSARSLTIIGANPAAEHTDWHHNPYEGNSGVAVYRGSDTTVSDCHISLTYGDAIYMGWQSTRILAERNTVRRTGRQGITATEVSDVTIRDNDVAQVTGSAIDLEPGTLLTRVLVTGNRLGGTGAQVNVNGQAVTDVRITDNRTPQALIVRAEAAAGGPGGRRRFARIEIDHNVGGAADNASPIDLETTPIVADNIDFLTVVGNRSGRTAPVLSAAGSCPARFAGNTDDRDRSFGHALQPEDPSGNAGDVAPTSRLDPDRLDPTPGIIRGYQRVLGLDPPVASLQGWSTSICRGSTTQAALLEWLLPRLDAAGQARSAVATLAPILLLRAATPDDLPVTAEGALAAVSRLLTDPVADAISEPGGEDGLARLARAAPVGSLLRAALETRPAGNARPLERAAAFLLAARTAPSTSVLGAVRDVNVAMLATSGGVATPADLVRWVPQIERGQLSRADVVRDLLATGANRIRQPTCNGTIVGRRLLALFGPFPTLGAPVSAC